MGKNKLQKVSITYYMQHDRCKNDYVCSINLHVITSEHFSPNEDREIKKSILFFLWAVPVWNNYTAASQKICARLRIQRDSS